MKNKKTIKHIEKKHYDYFQKDNLIIFGFFTLIGIYLYISFYRKVYYPVKQFSLKKRNESGYVLLVSGELEHRALAEQWLGRKLSPDEEVHHINGKRWDNRRYNLSVMTRENHRRWHERLDWMFANKMFPSIETQRKKLAQEFEAILF